MVEILLGSVGPQKMQHSRRISDTFVLWNFYLSHSSTKALARWYFLTFFFFSFVCFQLNDAPLAVHGAF